MKGLNIQVYDIISNSNLKGVRIVAKKKMLGGFFPQYNIEIRSQESVADRGPLFAK